MSGLRTRFRLEEREAPIIPKNTPIPVRKSEAFRTVHDNQKEVDVRIYQGENEDALENIQIGEFRVEDLADAPAGNMIILDLALDRDGILHVLTPVANMTPVVRAISVANPLTHFISLSRSVFLEGAGIPDVLHQLTTLAAMAILLTAGAVGAFRNGIYR